MPIAHRATATYASSAASTTHTFTIPSGAQVGDFLILEVGNSIANRVPTRPTGWIYGDLDTTGTGHNISTIGKFCEAGDPGSSLILTWAGGAVDAQGGIVAYSGVDPTTPFDVALTKELIDASGNSHTAPTITPVSDGTLLCHAFVPNGIAGTGWDTVVGATERFEVEAAAGTPRPTLFVDRVGPAAGVPSSALVASFVGAGAYQVSMHTIALRAVPVYDETLRPTGVSGLSNLTGAYTDIDQDPDGTITDPGLIASDPSAVTGIVNGPELPASATGAAGFAGSIPPLTSVYDGDDVTAAATAMTTAGSNYGAHFHWAAGAFSDIPTDATITGIVLKVRHGANQLNRSDQFFQLATAQNVPLGNEVQSDATTTVSDVFLTQTNFGVTPTRAQLVTGTFAVRVRAIRSAVVTYSLYELELTVTYATPARTVDTQVDVAMGNPVDALSTGAATGEVVCLVRKRGTAPAADPQARIELRNGAGTLLGTVIPDSGALVGTSPFRLSGQFNQSLILDKNDVVLRFVGTGVAGELAELLAIEWNAMTQPAAQPIRSVGMVGIRGTQ